MPRGEAAEVARTMNERIDGVVPPPRTPRVFVAEWLDPPFVAGHWVPEMVEWAGGTDVLGSAGEPSFRTTWDAVAAARPELAVLAPCGFDRARTLAEAAAVDGLPELPCRRGGRRTRTSRGPAPGSPRASRSWPALLHAWSTASLEPDLVSR